MKYLLIASLVVVLALYGWRWVNAHDCYQYDHDCDGFVGAADSGIQASHYGDRLLNGQWVPGPYAGWTPSATVGPSWTPTIPATSTVTPDVTATPTSVASPTLTTTATFTITPTSSSTATTVATFTSTPTRTPQPTVTPTRTATNTPVATSTPTPSSGVVIFPPANVQAVVNAHPAGTTYLIQPGTLTNQSIVPKNGDRFFGQGTFMDGATLQQYAFRGNATNVTVDGFIIHHYNSPSQRGAISNQHNGGTYWTISNNEFRYNAAYGVRANTGDKLLNNYFHHNEQAGFGGVGNDILAEGNEVAFNNPNGAYDSGWEAGGSKWSHTNNLILRDNYVHRNNGPGLWTDISNEDTLMEGNVLEYNEGPGIFHEISFSAIIRENTLTNNGTNYNVWLWGSQILISTSADVEVYDNIVVSPYNANGIGVVQQDRGSYLGYPVSVHHNDVTLGSLSSTIAHTGAVQDHDPTGQFFANVTMDYNAYHVANTGASHFEWANGRRTFAQLRALGREIHGTID